MHSACIARLISTFNGLKLQAIINAQIDENNCLEWGKRISEKWYFDKIKSIHPIHQRLIAEPNFIVSDLYYSAIRSLIINFSSTLEFFIKDSLRLNMMRNYSLLKKALMENKQNIDPKDIVEFNDIEQIRLKYINTLSEHICSGELWKNKFKKYTKILSLPNSLYENDINDKIDAIWEMRNDIAHANTKSLTLVYEGDIYPYSPNVSVEEYTQFALLFVELVDDVIVFLSNVDKETLDKWEATDATLLHKYSRENNSGV